MTYLSTPSEEALLYHDPGRSGYVALFSGDTQRMYQMSELRGALENIPLDQNVYLSQGEFSKKSRRLVDLACLPVCYVDLETYQIPWIAELHPEQQALAVVLYCEEAGLPRPSLINYSGRGLHVKWLLDSPVPAEALPLWNAVQKSLVDAFKDFGVDKGARDGSRCLRVVGSINPRSGNVCRTVWQEEHGGEILRWDFDTICREVLPVEQVVIKPKRQRQEQAPIQVSSHTGWRNGWSSQTLWWKRLNDMRILIGLRGWTDGVPEGYRNNFLYVASCAVCWGACINESDLEAEVNEIAREFCPSFSPAEVRSSTASVLRMHQEGKDYRFSDERLTELLGIQPNERKWLVTIIGEEERQERHRIACRERNRKNTDRATYEQNAAERREQAHTLRLQGLSYKDIAIQMGCTVNAVDKLLRSVSAPTVAIPAYPPHA